jgi:hypothetical protein
MARTQPLLADTPRRTDHPFLHRRSQVFRILDEAPRTAVRVCAEVAVSDHLAVGVIGAATGGPPAALSVWRLGRQTELLADGGYLAAPAR